MIKSVGFKPMNIWVSICVVMSRLICVMLNLNKYRYEPFINRVETSNADMTRLLIMLIMY